MFAERSREIQKEKADEQELLSWASSQPKDHLGSELDQTTCAFKTFATPVWPTACQEGRFQLDHLVWVPPSEEMFKLLKSKSARGWQGIDVQKLWDDLQEKWEELHRHVSHRYSKPLGKVPTFEHKLCYYAGFCLCSRDGFFCRVISGALRSAFKLWFSKGSSTRRLFDLGCVCVCLWNDGANTQRIFYHVGFGNLSTLHFTFAFLELVRGQRQNIAALHNRVACRFARNAPSFGWNVWACLRDLDPAVSWYAQLWRLSSSDDLAQSFIPGEVEIESIVPLQHRLIWIPRRRAPRRRGPGPGPCPDPLGGHPWSLQDLEGVAIQEPAEGDDGDVEVDAEVDSGVDALLAIADAEEEIGSDSGHDESEAEGSDTDFDPNDDPWEVDFGVAPPVDEPKGPEPSVDPPAPPPPPEPEPPADAAAGRGDDEAAARPKKRIKMVVVGERAKPGEREIPWGPFSLSEITRKKVVIGWGANCRQHRDLDDVPGTICKKSITFGVLELTEDILHRKLKEWLINGLRQDRDRARVRLPPGMERSIHLGFNIRTLNPRSDELLDDELRSLGHEP